ncbi:di-heme oxidoredictase family protein, partial [Wenyingzhuangia sp. 1_MG-2023]|nr:di-heme oxidoredictase family protein [Wenyingzhuangia sp. 1_MG-2023]
PCTDQQSICSEQPSGGDPEVSLDSLNAINDFLTLLAVYDRRIDDQTQFDRGAGLFEQVGCDDCHRPTLTTGDTSAFEQLNQQTIYAYTDLLLHDMGEALSDGMKEG